MNGMAINHDALVNLVERILAAKRAEQPSRGATACQAAAADTWAWRRGIGEAVDRFCGAWRWWALQDLNL